MYDLASTLHSGSFHQILRAPVFVVERGNKKTRWPEPSRLLRIRRSNCQQQIYGVEPAAAAPPPPADRIRGDGMLPLYIELID